MNAVWVVLDFSHYCCRIPDKNSVRKEVYLNLHLSGTVRNEENIRHTQNTVGIRWTAF